MLATSWLSVLHIMGVILLLSALVLGGISLFQTQQQQVVTLKWRKFLIALQHLALTLLLISGIALLVMMQFKIETWFYAKIILFLVLFSSLIKAYKNDSSILLIQRKAGWLLACIAFVAIYGLVILQPNFT
ncbi:MULTISPECIES: SirB2 family protein [unclassified Acinetobacter]|uniref:SirB2 family protein n=1 Tax=unclassified Acinetobacter TaxID=196816 RepID=UPI0029345488|nr:MULTISPECIES: SirB2 family protein [unclassified Acinetobacter]WOE30740.1 SirB2 family protein [Acinetobacter sp. SAAs470]WOE38933.1 SirB2 family protein [Acinetobacter sp. SAAs474]